MKLIHLVSEAQEIYRKRGPWEIRKWRNRKRKGLEIAKICGIGEDYHLVDRFERIVYDNIASSIIKIQRMETEILHMYAIMEMLCLSGVARNGYGIRLNGICVKVNLRDTASLASESKDGKPYSNAYIEIWSRTDGDLRKIEINRPARINLSEDVVAGMSTTRIARALKEALEDFPKFREYFIQEVTRRLNEAKKKI